MTIEEMRKKLNQFCDSYHDCSICPRDDNEFCDNYGVDYAPEDVIQVWYELFFGSDPTSAAAEEPHIRASESVTETVNHPKHYVREGAMECIDEMLVVFGVEATQSFCLLNAWKYRYRAGVKGGEEDMKKSDWYLAKYAELRGGD